MSPIIAFAEDRRIAEGDPIDVALELKAWLKGHGDIPFLVFDFTTSRSIDLDLRGDEDEIRARFGSPSESQLRPPASRGRPKLGVVAREVTLLPQQWEWLATQRGGASAAIRRLVHEARREGSGADTRRQAQEALYRFITAMAGNAAGYEEAVRALFAGDEEGFRRRIVGWSEDVRAHALERARPAFGAGSALARFVPAERLTAATQALRAALGDVEFTRVEPLRAGASGATVLQVEAGTRRCVLRMDEPSDGLRDAARHYACHAIAAQAHVAPRLLYAGVEDRTAITDYLENTPVEARGETLAALATSLRQLHAAPLFPPLLPFLEGLERVLAGFSATGVAPELATQLHAMFRLIRAADGPSAADIVSSHNDLHPRNVVFTGGKALFVDWEMAFAADRYVDLSAAVNFFARDEGDEAVVLREYFGRAPSPVERARLELMRQVNRIFYGVMPLCAIHRGDPGFKLPANALDTVPFSQREVRKPSLGSVSGRVDLACSLLVDALAARETPGFRWALDHARG